ncbi:protein neprosin-like [Tasmannia lanceolata]|uniref:protein neprosin-like n=1 Tax=Tasmannia lanceolata TaxID=3420 RepID=UPI004063098A
MALKQVMVLVFVTTFLVFMIVYGVEGRGRILSREEDLELEKQLKLLNKPARKSIQTEYGDIFDCVDINKQPALDHPLLKNHKIQMRPTSLPKGWTDKDSTISTTIQFGLKEGCPMGTVPIRRTRKEDLIRAHSDSTPLKYHHSRVIYENGEVLGAQAVINVWNPSVAENKGSLSKFCVRNGDGALVNSIEVGTGVYSDIVGDNQTRLITRWTADNFQKTGCYNSLCPGFVQISPKISLGAVVKPYSTYNGAQYGLRIIVFKDQTIGQGYWWLGVDETVVGYWPNNLFTTLSTKGVTTIWWGGEVVGPQNEPGPPMGSGHLPMEGPKKAAYFRTLKLVNVKFFLEDPDQYKLSTDSDAVMCYQADGAARLGPPWEFTFYYGGPGGC